MTQVTAGQWERLAAAQSGLMSRSQLAACGVSRWAVAHRISSGRWTAVSPTVVATFTGDLSRLQRMWAATLHAGAEAVLSGPTALEVHGLKRWERDEIHICVPYRVGRIRPMAGVVVARSRRPVVAWTTSGDLPTLRIQPATLLHAATQTSDRARTGLLAAVVQQRLTTAESLQRWLERLRPLPGSARMGRALVDIAGGSESTAELDVLDMCRVFGLPRPIRQRRRRDSSGRLRFTDSEWEIGGGITVVLEVDGGFHMDAESWEDDIVRQRGLIAPNVLIARCTSRELRDCPGPVVHDLIRLGVPRL